MPSIAPTVLDALDLVGLYVVVPMAELSTAVPAANRQLLERYERIEGRCGRHLLDVSLKVEEGIYTQFVGVEVHPDAPTPEGLERLHLPRQRWLHLSHRAPVTEIGTSFGAMRAFGEEQRLPTEHVFLEFHPIDGQGPVELYVRLAPRPENIVHWREIQRPDTATYPGSDELLSIGSPLGRHLGMRHFGIHHEVLPPGRRTSWPHAESTEDEFIYVLEGSPDVWMDGHLHRLSCGDAVGFVAGTGQAHTFINNTDTPARLLVIGDSHRDDNLCYYAHDEDRNREISDFYWDIERPPLGPHDGLPDRLRDRLNTPADED
nr:cupin domain-containing protein [Lujinxingia vulgaris]